MRANRIAWAVSGLALLILVAGVLARPQVGDNALYLPIAVPFVSVGALLASRRPSNPIGSRPKSSASHPGFVIW
jgi:hypothetical protein